MKLIINLFASMVGIPPNINANDIALSGGFAVPEPIVANKKVRTTMALVACRNSIARFL